MTTSRADDRAGDATTRDGTGRYEEIVARLRRSGSVFAEDEARLILEAPGATSTHIDPAAEHDLEALLARRERGVPLEHLLGWAEFGDRRILVVSGVFVPRSRSMLMVRTALGGLASGAVVVDLCCGSGAIGAVVEASGILIDLHSTDIDPHAVECARRNLLHPGQVYVGDLFAPLPAEVRGTVSVVLANAPYVPRDELRLMPREAREYEPRVALDGGGDGLELHRRIAAEAPDWLENGGRLLIETSRRQSRALAEILEAARFGVRIVHDDELDATVVVGFRAAP